MLGDTGIAVNPEDERYTHLVGKHCNTSINRKRTSNSCWWLCWFRDFGTGAVKMTPAHDPNDFEVGQRHNLEEINVMNEDGTMNELSW